jgi:hypothetical protein
MKVHAFLLSLLIRGIHIDLTWLHRPLMWFITFITPEPEDRVRVVWTEDWNDQSQFAPLVESMPEYDVIGFGSCGGERHIEFLRKS